MLVGGDTPNPLTMSPTHVHTGGGFLGLHQASSISTPQPALVALVLQSKGKSNAPPPPEPRNAFQLRWLCPDHRERMWTGRVSAAWRRPLCWLPRVMGPQSRKHGGGAGGKAHLSDGSRRDFHYLAPPPPPGCFQAPPAPR